VTLNNIKQMSFSRNPRIARVLSDFGIVKELNEGVKRIYNDMENFFLEDPEYTEPGQQAVKLTLRNNILMRRMRQKESAENRIGEEKWAQLDYTERAIISYLASIKEATNAKIVKIVRKSSRTVTSKLNHLIGLDIVNINGNKYDPSHTYSLKW
jgi:ATP-dependent DNA helicase RecG